MRILLVSFVANNTWSGMGKWSHEMAGALDRAGHAVTLWFSDAFSFVRRMGTAAKLLFPAVLAMRICWHARDFDVVVIHEPSGYWYAWLRRLRKSLPPMVLMCHNVESRNLHDLRVAAARGFADVPFSTRLKAPLFRLWQSDGAIRRADHVVCLSVADQRYIVERLGRPGRTVSVAINGVRSDEVDERSRERQSQRVLWVGGWINVKGRYVIPHLWARVLERAPAAHLTLIGTHAADEIVLGSFPAEQRRSITNVPKITSPEDMREAYRSHDLLVMPSLSEGSPLALLEAMASGIPVVASRVGGIEQVVTDGVDGLLFAAMDVAAGADRVCAVLLDPQLAARLGQAARETVRHLTWDASARTLQYAIDAATGSRGITCVT